MPSSGSTCQTVVSYIPRPNATPEAELSALAAAYRFILDSKKKKEGSRPGAPDDEKERSVHDSLASTNYTR